MSTTTIPPIHQYQFKRGHFQYQASRKRRLALFLYFIVLLVGLSVLPAPALAPIQPAQASAWDAPPYPVTSAPDKEPDILAAQKSQVKAGAVAYIRSVNKSLDGDDARMFADHVVKAASEFKLNLSVLLALIKVESGFNPDAVSPAGALGLTQVIPKWHTTRIADARKVVDAYSVFEPRLNIYVGASALRDFINSSRSLNDALLLYNGSANDPKGSYANLVMAEAYVVQTKYLLAKS